MSGMTYKVDFPTDVTVESGYIRDATLGQSYPLNDTADMYLSLLHVGVPMTDIVDSVSAQFGISSKVVERDLLSLVVRLNEAQLVNIYPSGLLERIKRQVWVVKFVLTTGVLPPLLIKRMPIVDGGPVLVAINVARTLSRHVLLPMMLSAFIVLTLGILTDPAIAYLVAAVLVGIFTAFILHEAGHAVAVRASGRKSYLIAAGLKIAVAHTHRSSAFVHASGSLVTYLVGLILLLSAYLTHSVLPAVASVPLITQLVFVTVLARDGRLLVDSLS